MLKSIKCTIMRGGTSKGVFLHERNLPPPGEARDRLLLRIMGSPDSKQIDGIGGATSVTSKVAIIAGSSRPDADVNYTFAQVAIDKAVVDYRGNCGNISSAVGPYAIEKGMVPVREPSTLVRIINTNTNKIIHAEVPTNNGSVEYGGDYEIAGVPGKAARITLTFFDPAGAVTGRLLPTGNVRDTLGVPGLGNVVVSIVDAANPLVFINAEDIGLSGVEMPQAIDGSEDMLRKLEAIRAAAAVKLGFVEDWKKSAVLSPAVPKMTLVTRPKEYALPGRRIIRETDVDIVGRMMSMQKTHKTYALTGALCTGVAAVLKGSVVNELASPQRDKRNIRIGHPDGIIEAGVSVDDREGECRIVSVTGYRTARLLMDGRVYC